MPYLSTQNDQTIIALYIQPKSSKNTFRGLYGTEMKLAITAPPVDGKANKAVILFLAKLLGVSKSAVSLKRGIQSRHKKFAVGMTEEEVRMKIEGAVC
jgi:uncharacterized protein (TIGR00251 family)